MSAMADASDRAETTADLYQPLSREPVRPNTWYLALFEWYGSTFPKAVFGLLERVSICAALQYAAARTHNGVVKAVGFVAVAALLAWFTHGIFAVLPPRDKLQGWFHGKLFLYPLSLGVLLISATAAAVITYFAAFETVISIVTAAYK